jgi:putative transposase
MRACPGEPLCDPPAMTPSLAAAPQRRAYDHRLREHVCRTGSHALSRRLEIPRSTITTWKRRGLRPVVSVEMFGADRHQLLSTIEKLEKRAQILAATVRLLLALVRASGFRLANQRLPEGAVKASILRAITSATNALPLAVSLRILGLPVSRYHAWRRADKVCGLDDRSSCPRIAPGQITAVEVADIKAMVLDSHYRHMPLRTLSLYAQRIGKVFASATTWARLVRERGWRRPRLRVHPEKPTVGVRATRPDEIWHIDVTVVRLLNGVRVYIHAVIDNFSRKILAWTIAARLDPMTTCEVLVEAGRHLDPVAVRPTLMADSGVENVNAAVDATLLTTRIRRVLAQVEVTESNSMIEAWWRSLKHQWLYLNSLDTIERVRSLVAFFVDAHNANMPHAAFRGQTPDEMYFGTAPDLTANLADARKKARELRLATNRGASCSRCTMPPEPSVGPEISP